MTAATPAAVGSAPPWALPAEEVLGDLGSSRGGLSAEEVEVRLAASPRAHRHLRLGWARVLLRQFSSPIVLILVTATLIAMTVGDVADGAIIIAIIAISGLLGFVQDFRAGRDVAALLERVQVLTTVVRDGERQQVPVPLVVPGDVVVLSAGSVVPGDCRLLDAQSLLVDESALTGESFPAEKDAHDIAPAAAPLSERTSVLFSGTHVVSGSCLAVVYGTGAGTELGRVTRELRGKRPASAYQRGTTQFGVLLVRLMVVLTAFIFVVNAVLGRPLLDSFLFSLALAVGLTPQMLPAITAISLSAGARRMARERVIVKRLEVIEDFGAMRILCTDKTGTLTEGAPRLDLALRLDGEESERVLDLAALNAGLQDGFENPMDEAILRRSPLPAGARAAGQVPYDFTRKRMTVLTEVDAAPTLIVKGALAGVLDCCSHATVHGRRVDAREVRDDVQARFEELSARGFRVLAVATRPWRDDEPPLGPDSERGLVLEGLLAFRDPVKPTATHAVRDLESSGIALKLVTGDNALAARATAEAVGLDTRRILTGPEIDDLDDAALVPQVSGVAVFAEVEPLHKRRIVLALRGPDVGVGFLGDGINDAPALHAADVSISVDSAVAVAKEAASIVLLDKGLDVVADGVRVGRQTFANTLKYVRLTTSANFGNMLSMAGASLFLPFLPLLPRQILLLNFLSDIPSTAIASDEVDPEQTAAPAGWDVGGIHRFLVVFGAVSTVFDLLTFGLLLVVLHAGPTEFRSGWFIESTVSELLVLFSLRTNRPMLRSRPAPLLVWLSVAVAVVVTALPFVPVLAQPLGLAAPGADVIAAIAAIAVTYVVTNEAVKAVFVRRAPHERTSARELELRLLSAARGHWRRGTPPPLWRG